MCTKGSEGDKLKQKRVINLILIFGAMKMKMWENVGPEKFEKPSRSSNYIVFLHNFGSF